MVPLHKPSCLGEKTGGLSARSVLRVCAHSLVCLAMSFVVTFSADAQTSKKVRPVEETQNQKPELTLDESRNDLDALRKGWSAAFSLQGGGGIFFREQQEDVGRGWGRVLLGALAFREPWILSFGPTASLGGTSTWALGAEVVIAHLWSGFWAAMGAAWPGERGSTYRLSAGFSVFGVEFETRRGGDTQGQALWFMLRLPIGTFLALR